MHELIEQVITELRSAWRFRWIALAVAWIVCVIGWSVVFVLPDQYESQAVFYVGTSRLDVVLDEEDADRSLVERVRQRMLFTPSLEAVARETDLDLRATTQAEKDGLIASLARSINIEPVNTSRRSRNSDETIFRISYRDSDPRMSLRVVDEVLDTFREEVGEGRTGGSDDALEFLESGIEEYRARLRTLEQEIADFRRANVGLLPGEGRGYFETLQDALAENRTIQAELQLLLQQRDTLLSQLRGQQPILPDDSTGSLLPQNELEARIAELESSIQELLTRFTERYPDVIAARDQLEQLKAQRAKQLEELAQAGETGNIASNNPVYQQLQISLNEINLRISELEARLSASNRLVADLEGKIDVIPDIEAQLAELTRDYDEIRNVYADMRAKYEQELLRRKRLGWANVTFDTMEPPRVGREPVAPLRVQLLLLITLAGLGAGAGVAYLLQQLKPVFLDANGLRRYTELPVLGSVSLAWESRHKNKRRRELAVFASAAAMILVAAVLLLIFKDAGIEVGTEVRKLASL